MGDQITLYRFPNGVKGGKRGVLGGDRTEVPRELVVVVVPELQVQPVVPRLRLAQVR